MWCLPQSELGIGAPRVELTSQAVDAAKELGNGRAQKRGGPIGELSAACACQ